MSYSLLVNHYNNYSAPHKNLRLEIAQKILKDIPSTASIIDVGCGNGDMLEIIRSLGYQNIRGIDLSEEMIAIARSKGLDCVVGDFMGNELDQSDVVIAQAFVHLFPKAELVNIIKKLIGMTKRVLYFCTTQESVSEEGMFLKGGIMRFRAKYQRDEFINIVKENFSEYSGEYFEMNDPEGKTWTNQIIDMDNLIYKNDGFLVLKNMIDQKGIELLLNYVEMMSKGSNDPLVLRYKERDVECSNESLDRIENILFNPPPEIKKLLEPLNRLVKKVWGYEPALFKDKVNFKQPKKRPFPAHQDALAGWDAFSSKQITLCISLDSSNAENGCLEFVKNSHKIGLLAKVGQIIDPELEKMMKWDKIPTNQGDVIIFDSYTPHRSGYNNSETTRRMMFITYIPIENYDPRIVREKILKKRETQPTIDDEEKPLIRDIYGKYVLAK